MKNGFTLIELMITITILAIVVAFGVPGFSNIIKNNRLASQTNTLLSTLNFARSDAVKLGNSTVTICGSSNQTACNTSNWESGWIVFHDTNGDGVVDAGEQVVRIQEALSGGNTLRTTGFPSTALLQFDKRGEIVQQGTFTLCDSRGAAAANAVVLNISGQSRSATDDDDPQDGIVNISTGGNATCP